MMRTETPATMLAKPARELVRHFALGDVARGLFRDSLTTRQYLDLLLQKQQYPEATRLLAHALPKREAVWWACLCVRGATGGLPDKLGAAVQAAEKWVAEPTEAHCRAAESAAAAAGVGTAAGSTALAAFCSGGSLGPPNVPVIAPAEHLTAQAVAAAVLLAAVAAEPEKAEEKYGVFLCQGTEVANGVRRWN